MEDLLKSAITAIKKRWKRKTFVIGWDDYIAIAIALIGVLGFVDGPIAYIPGLTNVYHQIRVELIGIGITVLIIGNANEAVKTHQEKERLILQMGSDSNSFAREAVRQLRSRGWLFDGSLSGASLVGADLSEAYLVVADLSGTDLKGADLSRATLSLTNLSGADLNGADLSGADLIGANLSEANLRGADLSGADLITANLSEANLRGADLSGTDLIRTILSGAFYDKDTKWPDNFNHEEAGAKMKEDYFEGQEAFKDLSDYYSELFREFEQKLDEQNNSTDQ